MLPFTVLDAAGRVARHDDLHEHRRRAPARRDRQHLVRRAAAQRTPLNTAVQAAAAGHAFEALDCIAVEFRTHRFNQQSRRAIERLGAQLDGILRAHQRSADGTLRDTAVYSITAAEWPTVRAHLRLAARATATAADAGRADTPRRPHGQARRPSRVDDLWRIERLGTPSLAPDGAQAVAALTRHLDGRQQGDQPRCGCCRRWAARRGR